VVRTRVGYAGGTKENPTYHSLGDHSESLQIDYDPSRISYEQLLDVFWASHDATQKPWSRQYISVIFYHDEEQKRLATASMEREQERRGKKILTEIVPLQKFYLAEDYHQKYYLLNEFRLAREYQAIYPAQEDFLDSTAVSRVNGYIGGNGSSEQLEREISSLGLSPEGENFLREKMHDYESAGRNWCPAPQVN